MKNFLTTLIIILLLMIICSADSTFAASKKSRKEMKSIGVFANYNGPDNVLDEGYDSDFAAGIKAAYHINQNLGLELAFSSFKFDGGSYKDSYDTRIIDSHRVNVFYKFDTNTNLYPFATAGLGYYMVEKGPDAPGINFGVGASTDLVALSKNLSADLSWNYHRMLNSGGDMSFYEIRAGLNFNFY
ncbi:outer membrane beta-barrel protein [Thermodesulfobacteriota bacterium]